MAFSDFKSISEVQKRYQIRYAQMLAAQKINKNPQRAVYGIVKDGNLWQFGRLLTDVFTKHDRNFTIDNLANLYGSLEQLIRKL
ncbi:MAG: hypothetical protein AAFQ89_23235 [Cyanobacteria bacterium J06626_18]